MRWEDEQQKKQQRLLCDEDTEDDDKKSISSESSCEEAESPSAQKYFTSQSNDLDMWQMNEVDEVLRELPNAEAILEMLNEGSFDSKCTLIFSIFFIFFSVLSEPFSSKYTFEM